MSAGSTILQFVNARSLLAATAVVAAAFFTTQRAPADGDGAPTKGPTTAVLFRITKSENRNRVVYAIRLGADCMPVGPRPVYAEWEMLERGPGKTEPLLDREQGLYGVGAQRVSRGKGGATVAFSVRGLPERNIEVTTSSTGKCEAIAATRIDSAMARLEGIFVEVGWPFGVEGIRIWGRKVDGDQPVAERL